jgi:hypothetical protein
MREKMAKKKINNEITLNEKIDKLLNVLDDPATTCKFWKTDDTSSHLMGLRPVKRTTVEIIGKDSFNPYEKKIDENLFKVFIIYISQNEKENILNPQELEYKNDLENKGYIYLKHHDLLYIYEFIRNNT